jgi:hypothetical protein
MQQEAIDRFISRINFTANNACWNWCAGKNNSGYGSFSAGGKAYGAHRFSYIITFGDISNDELVCHSCDNPSCVNPNHLWVGTVKDNIADKVRKNRQPKGDSHPRPKSKRTHCLSGHEYNNENTYWTKSNHRKCRRCHADFETIRRVKRLEKLNYNQNTKGIS